MSQSVAEPASHHMLLIGLGPGLAYLHHPKLARQLSEWLDERGSHIVLSTSLRRNILALHCAAHQKQLISFQPSKLDDRGRFIAKSCNASVTLSHSPWFPDRAPFKRNIFRDIFYGPLFKKAVHRVFQLIEFSQGTLMGVTHWLLMLWLSFHAFQSLHFSSVYNAGA